MVAAKFVNVGTLGSFEATGKHSSKPADVDALFQHLEDLKAKSLVLHFHGGLISEAKGIAIAEKMAPVRVLVSWSLMLSAMWWVATPKITSK